MNSVFQYQNDKLQFYEKLSLLTTSTKFYDMEKLINNILYFPGNIIQKVYFSFVQILVETKSIVWLGEP